ncbi:hypothetical protein VUR80DRAFT_9577 [Thermomyces stellatus]
MPVVRRFKWDACLNCACLLRRADSTTRSWQTAAVGTCTTPCRCTLAPRPALFVRSQRPFFHSRKRIRAEATRPQDWYQISLSSSRQHRCAPARWCSHWCGLPSLFIGPVRNSAPGHICPSIVHDLSQSLVCAHMRMCHLLTGPPPPTFLLGPRRIKTR